MVNTVPVSSCEVAEACKILENTYRSVNIAMVNELKMLFDRLGIDVWEVIDAAKTKPFGFQAFYPGPGLGGHCIPIDPFYLSWVARKHGMITRFIELAGEINTSMPHYVIQRLAEALNDVGKPLNGSKICDPGHGLQEGRRRSARKPVVRADGAAAGRQGEGDLQRSARAASAADAASSGAADGEPAADGRISGRPGLRADRHRPLGLRLRLHRAHLAAGRSTPATPPRTSSRAREDPQGVTPVRRDRRHAAACRPARLTTLVGRAARRTAPDTRGSAACLPSGCRRTLPGRIELQHGAQLQLRRPDRPRSASRWSLVRSNVSCIAAPPNVRQILFDGSRIVCRLAEHVRNVAQVAQRARQVPFQDVGGQVVDLRERTASRKLAKWRYVLAAAAEIPRSCFTVLSKTTAE